MSFSILDFLSEGEANRYNRLSAVEPLTKEQKARAHFLRTGGRDCQLRKERKEREGKQ